MADQRKHTRPHPTVKMIPPGKRKPVDIDRKMAPLIEAIWKLGLRTTECCQDWEGDGVAYIVMPYNEPMRLRDLIGNRVVARILPVQGFFRVGKAIAVQSVAFIKTADLNSVTKAAVRLARTNVPTAGRSKPKGRVAVR